MSKPLILMLVAGVCFGGWPLIMNKSGLSGLPASFVVAGVAAVLTLLVGITSSTFTEHASSHASWFLAVVAGLCGALGLICLNIGIAEAGKYTVGRLLVIMMVIQVTVPAIYHVAVSEGFSLRAGVGFTAAVVAAVLLR
jgi:hypothetical protein